MASENTLRLFMREYRMLAVREFFDEANILSGGGASIGLPSFSRGAVPAVRGVQQKRADA
jgi:hypothetical protein